jgi:acyl-CoA dehydrogenase
MKLYAYRALDYLRAASPDDRRYLLFSAVQKAKVSTEGVKVMALLSECIGAKGFESSDTYFEMALRDAQLIPSLESSAHINLGLTAQFIPRYFARPDFDLVVPASSLVGEQFAHENSYLTEASPRTGAISTIAFPPYRQAYRPLMNLRNVRLFAAQSKAFRIFVWRMRSQRALMADTQIALGLGQCLATIAYAQLIAENSLRLNVAPEMISVIFHLLVGDLSASALTLASFPHFDVVSRFLIRRMVTIPRTRRAEWDFVSARMAAGPSS